MDQHRDNTLPLLASLDDPHQNRQHATVFAAGTDDIPPITGPRDFFREFSIEFKKLWYLAGPAIFTTIAQYSLGGITQVFAGHVSTIDLAAFTVENSVIASFSFAVMLGMGSALETLCGQAYGAGQLDILHLRGSDSKSDWADGGDFEGGGEIRAVDDSAAVRVRHELPDPEVLTIAEQDNGDGVDIGRGAGGARGAELVADAEGRVGSGGWCGGAERVLVGDSIGSVNLYTERHMWESLDRLLHESFSGSLGIRSLEMWYFMVLIIFAGYMKNAEVSVDALSVSMNILGWTVMVSIGMNAAISVRISNELGALHPRTAKFSLMVAVITSFMIGLFLALILIIFQNQYPSLFADDTEVKKLVMELTPMLAFSIVINNVQPVLSGVAVGAGWQAIVGYVNIACYYLIGIPLGLILGYKLNLGVLGIWSGMLVGTILQTCVLFFMVYRTNWNKEASLAEDRIKTWGGKKDISNSEGF
ncbi:protein DETOXIFICATION 29-like [Senna tora]|uniref:Protein DETOXIFICATION n=1 Tax=Senna tora TaxID=362788 RepID=A0A834STB5_9FABA|nr:protein DETOXIFICATION 29-like [Senna tora]